MKRTAFTLVEILIVVIILGILAAIVVPQFTDASNQAKVSSLQSDLQTARSQVELYKMEHNGNDPNMLSGAAAGNSAGFWGRMIGKTNDAGVVDNTVATNSGPYLQQPPTNPFANAGVGSDTIVFGAGAPAAGASADGWYYDTDTGKLSALGVGGNGEALELY